MTSSKFFSILVKINTATLFQIEIKICAEFLTYYNFLKQLNLWREEGHFQRNHLCRCCGELWAFSREQNRHVSCPYGIYMNETDKNWDYTKLQITVKQPSAYFILGPTHQFPKVNTQSLFVGSFNVLLIN